eukprot:TRINITY_DN10035_c0_g1_i3.p1 TRINITY_DN10035_c0_g1~~TRINITY_DN10035_c0_g1_i3.p1  ORF type:complete len:347 (-),score=38.69 TRINITY_DN10035_c0_g1_i3:20-1060(-)
MSFVAHLQSFSRDSLKKTATRVTSRDGTVTEEVLGDSGEYKVQGRSRIQLPSHIKIVKTLKWHFWEPSVSAWLPQSSLAASVADENKNLEPLSELRCISYNIWFADVEFERRAQALFQIFQQYRPHFICLQEVTPRFLSLLQSEEWAQQGYFLSAKPPQCDTVMPYGVSMLVSRQLPLAANLEPFTLHSLPSTMRRRFLWCNFSLRLAQYPQPVTLGVGTVHLESLANSDTRKEQLNLISEIVARPADALWMGDSNFRDDDSEVELLRASSFVDVWPAVPPEAPATFSMTDVGRIDRMLLRSTVLAPVSIELIGTETIGQTEDAKPLFPSDHFGLFATYRVVEPSV